jgi:hypothetical protein
MAIVAVIWVVGFAAYFYLTDERDRENVLLAGWLLLLGSSVLALATGLLR